jgi:hypothetical protein
MLSYWGSSLRMSLVWMGCCGTLLPMNVWAADGQPTPQADRQVEVAAPAAVTVSDVALQSDNVLNGQVIDGEGRPIAGAPVSLVQRQKEVATVQSASDGSFHVAGVRGGVYQVISSQSDNTYRAWPQGAAPPAAQSKIVLVQYSQNGPGPAGPHLSGPMMLGIAAVVAAAVAIPVVLANRHHGSSS